MPVMIIPDFRTPQTIDSESHNFRTGVQDKRMKVGYARVSTGDQKIDSQIEDLQREGCEKIFEGKFSGVSTENDQQLDKMLSFIRESDVVVVCRLDRLGRTLKRILEVIDAIHDKSASLKTLDGSLDTSKKSPMATAMISLLALFAQLERDLINDRTSEGRMRAKAQGKHLGRSTALSEATQKLITNKLEQGASVSALARDYKVSRQTIIRYNEKWKKDKL